MKAVTRRLDNDVDLLAAGDVLFERNRLGLAGRGVAARVAWPDATAFLAGIDCDDEVGLPGCGAVAFGARPFDPDAPAELIVPREVVGRAEDGTRWHTSILEAIGGPSGPLLPRESPSVFRIEPSRSPASWCALVEDATKAMTDGPLRKVVLAREITVHADAPFDAGEILGRLRTTYPGCLLYRVDGFVGASPELLVSRAGDIVRSHPMAGTAARGGDPSTDARLAAALLASTKDREEHQITIDMVHDTLLNWCSYVDYEAEPSIVPVANVQHLATLVEVLGRRESADMRHPGGVRLTP